MQMKQKIKQLHVNSFYDTILMCVSLCYFRVRGLELHIKTFLRLTVIPRRSLPVTPSNRYRNPSKKVL